jgi:hypothetical protein
MIWFSIRILFNAVPDDISITMNEMQLCGHKRMEQVACRGTVICNLSSINSIPRIGK